MPTNPEGYMQKYYQSHKSKWIEREVKTICQCTGKGVTKSKISRHNKSKKHTKWMLANPIVAEIELITEESKRT